VLPLPGTLTAVAEVNATTAPTLADEPLLTKSAPAAAAPSGAVDSVGNEQSDVSEPAASSGSIDTGIDTTADEFSAEAARELTTANESSATDGIEAAEAEGDSTTDVNDATEADEASANDVAKTGKTGKVSTDTKGSGASERTRGSASAASSSAASSSAGSDSSHGNSSDDGGGDS
jgi:hypothetical protein